MQFHRQSYAVLYACSLMLALLGCKESENESQREVEKPTEEPALSQKEIAVSRRPPDEAQLLALRDRLIKAVQAAPNSFSANNLEDQAGERWCAALKHSDRFNGWTGIVSTIETGDKGAVNIRIQNDELLEFEQTVIQDSEVFNKIKNVQQGTAVNISGSVDPDSYSCGRWSDLGLTTLKVHFENVNPIN